MDDTQPGTQTDDSAMSDDWRMRAEVAEAALLQSRSVADERLKHAELKVAAIRAGMIDLDGLKLLDFGRVKLAEDGSVPDAAEIIADLRKSKGWLFGATSSSSVATAPRAQPPRARTAQEMTEAEWRAARTALIK